jgi:hypothetical protein
MAVGRVAAAHDNAIGSALEGLDMHGVKAHCHSATDAWLFDDAFFDFAIDVLCYGEEPDAAGKKFYRSELKRTLMPGGYCLLCVPEESGNGGPDAMKTLEKEFESAGFTLVASDMADDDGVKVVSLIFQPVQHHL